MGSSRGPPVPSDRFWCPWRLFRGRSCGEDVRHLRPSWASLYRRRTFRPDGELRPSAQMVLNGLPHRPKAVVTGRRTFSHDAVCIMGATDERNRSCRSSADALVRCPERLVAPPSIREGCTYAAHVQTHAARRMRSVSIFGSPPNRIPHRPSAHRPWSRPHTMAFAPRTEHAMHSRPLFHDPIHSTGQKKK